MTGFKNLAIETEPAKDKDDFSDPISTFPSLYHQQGSVAMGLDKCYVLHIAKCGDRLCAVSDTGTLSVYSLDTLVKTDTLRPHSVCVTGLANCHTEPDLVYTCSVDQTVCVWDLRLATHTPVQTLKDSSQSKFTGPPSTPGKPLNCVAVNTAGLVAAGTEQVGGDSFILFWDTRTGDKLMGGYWDTHSDDVTSLQFHSDKKDILASSSTDGLVNVLDLSQPDEDSALVTSLNTEDSVGKVIWYNKKGDNMNLAIHTHTEGLQLWHTDSLAPHTLLDREEVCHGIRRTVRDHTYIAGVHPMEDEEGLVVIAGSSCTANPCLRLGLVRNKKVKPLARLGGVGGMVRCSLAVGGGYVTGGEDGVVRVWKEGEERDDHGSGKVSNNKTSVRDKPY